MSYGLNVSIKGKITRSDLEYPTENVSFAYLLAIDKAKVTQPLNYLVYPTATTVDSFTDKAVAFIGLGYRTAQEQRVTGNSYYYCHKDVGLTTQDFLIGYVTDNTGTTLTYEAVDLNQSYSNFIVFSITGSTLKGWRDVSLDNIPSTPATISCTDTNLASGQIGATHGWGTSAFSGSAPETRILAPYSPLKPAKVILEVEIEKIDNQYQPKLYSKLHPTAKYDILNNKGFTDEEIKLIFPELKTHYDLAAVTCGLFDYKPNSNTAVAIITEGNPYTENAIQQQTEYAKKKNLMVFKPPKSPQEAIEQYKELRKHFDFIAGKHNWLYQVFGHLDYEPLSVADFYDGCMQGIYKNAFKNVPDFELRNTVNRWINRLNASKVSYSEKEKHLKKLKSVLKK